MLKPVHDILVDAVLAGAARVLDVRRRGSIGTEYKDSTELVTQADRESDAAILAIFQQRFPAVDPSISFRLEESGVTGAVGPKRVGADPLDGTTHFSAGGNLYSVQAHYMEDNVPLVGVVFQPECFCPLSITERPSGRLVSAIHGQGATMRLTEYTGRAFQLGEARRVTKPIVPKTRTYIASVSVTGKMTPEERALACKVHNSGLLGGMTGVGNAGGNVMMIVFGGSQAYCNFGAGEELDLAPPQVIAQEVGLTVWGRDRRPPVWHTRKQPFVAALDDEIAEALLRAAGL